MVDAKVCLAHGGQGLALYLENAETGYTAVVPIRQMDENNEHANPAIASLVRVLGEEVWDS